MIVRECGTQGPRVIVLHGGPAAAGEMAPVARGLADYFRVLEPWQRGSGEEPLRVRRHAEDLRDMLAARPRVWRRPAIVGHSWGAMLALVFAASYPDMAGPLVLIGCGTFDEAARARLHATLEERMDEDLRRRLARLPAEYPDPAERLRHRHELMRPLYDYDAEPPEPLDSGPLDVRAHTETWQDMLRLQKEGIYPAGLDSMRSLVYMLHGTYDPHPGPLIRDSLASHVPIVEYRELERCGHDPWRERGARDEFFAVLRGWLHTHLSPGR